jgi:hypothetical protein
MKRSKIILAVLILSMIALIFSGCGGSGGTVPPISHSPTITSLTASPQSPIETNQSTVITCSASDPDGDSLTYTWSKTGGTITGTGSAITWTAPDIEGTYIIICTVSDGELTDEQSISIDVGQDLPPDTTEPELIEIASAEINLEEGGVIEVTDPESEFYGLQLIIEPQKNIQEKEKGVTMPFYIYVAFVEGCKLPGYHGFLTTPIVIKANLIDIICKLKIPYHDAQLLNAGVGKNEPVKVCRVLSTPLPWEELSPDKYTTSNNTTSIKMGFGDISYYYTLTVENAIPPDSSEFKDPIPGDLVYKFSKFWPAEINEGWLPGHVGIYVGLKYDEEEGKTYNVIEALLGGVTRSYYPFISSFGGNSVFLGAREPVGGLSHEKRKKIVAFVDNNKVIGKPYALWETASTVFLFSGLGRGNLVKGPDSYNCVGLAEAAYDSPGVDIDIVPNYDEGNVEYGSYHILTPAEQWNNMVPATGLPESNAPPEISDIEVIPEGLLNTNSIVSITCNAIDADEDDLTYNWMTPAGNFTSYVFIKGKSISWGTPDEEGIYTISCKVFDNYGGEDEKSINISVGLESYTITVSAGPNGSISPSGDVIVNEGSDKSFTITPDTGYQIDDVLVDGSSKGAVSSYTFTNVTEDHTIEATFTSMATGLVHNLTKDTYYSTIQAALDDADDNNTIEVADGTYDESINFLYGENLTLQSVNGASSTTIRGDDGLPTVSLYKTNGGSYILKGFTITHVSGNYGTGIYAKGNLTIKNCTIISNNYDYFGGGITNYNGIITITGSTISGNSVGDYSGGGIHNYAGVITITGSTISGNSAGHGGGIENYWGKITITGSTISDNSVKGSGGGIHNYGRVDSLTITGSTISGNSAGSYNGLGDGGGIGGMLQAAIIGGINQAEKNIICGNYQAGKDPCLEQQITDGDSGSLYETYKDTNYISAYCD